MLAEQQSTFNIDDGLRRFQTARAEFRTYLVAKRELEWRVRHALPSTNQFRKATEQLIWNSGVSHFQSCADDCAERFGASGPGGSFPGFESFIDVFYGNAQDVKTRVPEWSRKLYVRWSPPKRRGRGVRKPVPSRPTLMDRSLFRDLQRRALSFMTTVRALPGFNAAWEKKCVPTGVALVVEDGDLRAKEQRFRKNLARAARALENSPLCAQDVHDIALVLRRVIPSRGAAREILRCIGRLSGGEVRRSQNCAQGVAKQ